MLCDKCKQREANVHIKQSINGMTTERNLCEVCAREEEGLMGAFSMDHFFNDLFATSLLKRGSRRMGSMFDMAPQLQKAGSDRYNAEFVGVDQPFESGIELPKINLDPKKQEKRKAEVEKDGLKAQLEQAIKEENYEKAAEIRDLMKKKKEKSDETA
ncbi:UvrB/UvrC motif-containing protein [Christensenella tenuis]|uniref:UvrB/UvrC motif-containing protein n=1 Tax=Christensenella tenuis TaxID=2763033 RepID=A0ABR7EB12_9FIRM|nr:UvrB/UvrC motif-containing protein [Christensenella tenuis]MBC5646980.1 UvrB/UvrC motif-containing protein [Christensenella tenuis]